MKLLKEIKHKLFGYWEKEYDILFEYCMNLERINLDQRKMINELTDLVDKSAKVAEDALKSKLTKEEQFIQDYNQKVILPKKIGDIGAFA